MDKNIKKKYRIPSNDTRIKSIDKSLVGQINKLQRDLQFIADKRYGKGKINVSFQYASKIFAGRVK